MTFQERLVSVLQKMAPIACTPAKTCGCRWPFKSVEAEYKATKIKAAINLYANRDSTIELVRQFEEKAVRTGRRSLIKDAQNYASELDLELVLRHLVERRRSDRKEEDWSVDKEGAGERAPRENRRTEMARETDSMSRILIGSCL